jgi:hypothetical protein
MCLESSAMGSETNMCDFESEKRAKVSSVVSNVDITMPETPAAAAERGEAADRKRRSASSPRRDERDAPTMWR